MYSRKDWIEETDFHPHNDAEVLDHIFAETKKDSKAVVVFDLDSTLFDVGPRSFNLISRWLESTDARETRKYFEDLKVSEMGYGIEDLWVARGVPLSEKVYENELASAKRFWRDHFFSHEHLKWDLPMKGGVEFVKALYNTGAKIIYLTGRDVPTMAFGTYQQLADHGFPLDEKRTRLILKPKRHHDDIEFKTKVIAEVPPLLGNLVASFENEPKNLVSMASAMPKASHVFLETVCSPHKAPAGKGIYRIKGFESYAGKKS